MPRSGRKTRRLVKEIELTFLGISCLAVALVQFLLIFTISRQMIRDLEVQATSTADEIRDILLLPLYSMDEEQAIHIGQAVLSSGRVGGIRIESATSGIILDRLDGAAASLIAPQSRELRYDDFFLGVAYFHFSDVDIRATQQRFFLISVNVIVTMVVFILLAYRFILTRRIRAPLSDILDRIQAIGEGHLEKPLEPTRFSDVNILVSLINSMAASIRDQQEKLLEANSSLEDKVAERTAELQKSLGDLHKAQEKLVESEKMGLLGQLSAGIAHELNTPLGAIRSAAGTVINHMDTIQPRQRELLFSLDNNQKTLFLDLLQTGLSRQGSPEFSWKTRRSIQQNLDARGVADSRMAADYLSELRIDPREREVSGLLDDPRGEDILEVVHNLLMVRRMMEIVDMGANKASQVVSALRSYLSPGENKDSARVDINADIDKSLMLMHNYFKHGVRVVKDFSPAVVTGTADKLTQVWINLIRNGLHAMAFQGDLTIRTRTVGAMVEVRIIDTGHGIPEEIGEKIFEPFFTTKKEGEGMGLGLDICLRIIESHGGTIIFTSRRGNTEFLVTLPAAGGEG